MVDERFDPAKALDAAARYLVFARERLARDDLAVAAYHMGVGNLQGVLAAYGEADVPYAQLFFDSSPLRHAAAWQRLSRLGDDSSTYLWRIGAAREILRLHRSDPGELERLEALHSHKNSAEEVLHPPDGAERFGDPFAVGRAREAGELGALRAAQLRAHGLRIDPRMGELARRLRPVAAPVPGAAPCGALDAADDRRGRTRDQPRRRRADGHQHRPRRALPARARSPQRGGDARLLAAHDRLGLRRRARSYASRRQAMAFQFMLDRLTALNLIAWVREPAAIHVTVAPDAAQLLG